KKTIAQYGQVWFRDFGASLIMGSDILSLIVDHAHHHRLRSPADLLQHTKWCNSELYGDEIVQIIRLIRPPPPPAAVKSARLCGKCRAPGHRGQ
ncbi:uncharacterized protein SCHCODRAFT_02504957, partial [Schizophyllum commune H4-8]|uniref:uncharacterized protein n=1 Tax=Schizophyllum commune (strain H4-8 / FGSC 9210) TaxID=578458 RepID=UPI002160D3CC